MAFVFIGTYLNVVAFGDGHEFDPSALFDQIRQVMGAAVAIAVFCWWIGKLLGWLKYDRMVRSAIVFVFVESVLNYCALPFLHFGLATSFLFDREPRFDMPKLLILDLVIAVLAILMASLAYRFKRWFLPEALFLFISSVFMIFQARAVIDAYPPNPSFVQKTDPYVSVMTFDRERKNTLVILADGFAGSEFSRAVRAQPVLTEELTGFVSYKNTVSRHGGTWGSVPEMFGGEDYLVSKLLAKNKPWMDVYHEALQTLDQRLSRIGSGLDFIYGERSEDVAPEVRLSFFRRNSLAFSFLKLAPSIIKKPIYRFIRDDSRIVAHAKWGLLLKLLAEAKTGENNRVKVLHALVPHAPQFIPEHCQFVGVQEVSYEPSVYSEEAVCFLKYLAKLGQKLREIGVYDQTEIIVISDHGWMGHSSDFSEDMKDFGAGSFEGRADPGMLQALLLMKPVGAREPFRIDESQFMINTDLFAILCGKANGCSEAPDPFTLRNRTFRYYITSERYEPKAEYEVRNSPFEKKNWRRVK